MIAEPVLVVLAERGACVGKWDLFTADYPNLLEVRECQQICASCPVKTLCAELRDAINPNAGVWAGRLCKRGDT